MATNRHGSDTADAVRLTDVHKVFGGRENQVAALDGVTTGFARGSFTAIMGPSGSGKSTLLNLIAGLCCSAQRVSTSPRRARCSSTATSSARWTRPS